jgi:hypothetical protein
VVMLMTIKPNLTESGAITAIALAAGWLFGHITAGHRAIKSVAIAQASEYLTSYERRFLCSQFAIFETTS